MTLADDLRQALADRDAERPAGFATLRVERGMLAGAAPPLRLSRIVKRPLTWQKVEWNDD